MCTEKANCSDVRLCAIISRTQDRHLHDHSPSTPPPHELRSPPFFGAPDARKTAVLTETIKRLRNENWHLLCEVDLLKLALQNEKDKDMSARCRASKFLPF
jgi:hypothetical protein